MTIYDATSDMRFHQTGSRFSWLRVCGLAGRVAGSLAVLATATVGAQDVTVKDDVKQHITQGDKSKAVKQPPQITAEDMKREKKGRYGRHQYFAVQKDEQTVVLFIPALPRNDEAVIGAIRQVLTDVMNVPPTQHVTDVRLVGRYIRFITGSGVFDVLLIKEDNGTVNSFSIARWSK